MLVESLYEGTFLGGVSTAMGTRHQGVASGGTSRWTSRGSIEKSQWLPYLQLLFNLMRAQVAHWHARLALDSRSSHVPSQHPQEDCQGKQSPVPSRHHNDA